MTNYEKIKNMSVEEIAEFIQNTQSSYTEICDYCADKGRYELCGLNPCTFGIQQWLENEVL